VLAAGIPALRHAARRNAAGDRTLRLDNDNPFSSVAAASTQVSRG